MRVSLAAAGTAGHIEPALAVARWLTSHSDQISCEFIGTSAALDSALLQESGFISHSVTKAPFPRRPSLAAILWPMRFLRSLSQISKILSKSDLVIGFGGYVCAPTYLVAKIKGIPILIHEANAKPGMANNLGRRLGARLAIAFESTRKVDKRWVDATLVGMPIRESVKDLASASEQIREEVRAKKAADWGFDPQRPILLVFGGSQGSRAINAVIKEVATATGRIGVQIVHAVGSANQLPAREKNYLPLHYISDMPESMVASDFAITRGGAVTCAELGILRTFGVIIPLPIGNGEQEFNAAELVNVGGAEVISESQFTSKLLSERFLTFIKSAHEYRAREKEPIFALNAQEKIGEIALHMLTTTKKASQ